MSIFEHCPVTNQLAPTGGVGWGGVVTTHTHTRVQVFSLLLQGVGAGCARTFDY